MQVSQRNENSQSQIACRKDEALIAKPCLTKG